MRRRRRRSVRPGGAALGSDRIRMGAGRVGLGFVGRVPLDGLAS
jgi:hypothetical protein